MANPSASEVGIEVLLVLFTVWFVVGIIVTYIIAVAQGHVYYYFPYISDTGGLPPESCVFTLVISIGAVAMFFIVIIRSKQLRHYHDDFTCMSWINLLNLISLVFGLLSALGLILVASFQNVNVDEAHFLGAFMTFGFGLVYQWVQCAISFITYRSNHTKQLGRVLLFFRTLFSVITTCFFCLAIAAGLVALHTSHSKSLNTFLWNPSDGGYALHVVSTLSEWVMSISLVLFFLTFHPDFQLVHFEINVKLRSKNKDETTPLNA